MDEGSANKEEGKKKGASYISTGAGGVDFEVDVAAASLATLVTRSPSRFLPEGYVSSRIAFQYRAGPEGFDDVAIWGGSDLGSELSVFVQARRSFAFAAGGDFPGLVRAVEAHEAVDAGEWRAALVVGEASISVADIEVLLASARLSENDRDFFERWSAEGASNKAKRAFLDAVTAALAGDEGAAWRVMRRLMVLDFDYHREASRDRTAVIEQMAAAGSLTAPEAGALLGRLRDIALRTGSIAASWGRHELIAETGAMLAPLAVLRSSISAIEAAGDAALADISTHIQGIDPAPAISLTRTDLFAEARSILGGERCVRLSGEGGSGKSGLLRRICGQFAGRKLVLKDDRVTAHGWEAHQAAFGVPITAQALVDELAASGPCLLAIDGADRLLLSQRQGVVMDLLRAIAASPLRDRWSIVTSARDFQTRDLVAAAISEAGLNPGRRCPVGSLDRNEVQLLAEVFPQIAALAGRGDLGDRNRLLFVLREVLATPDLPVPCTEMTLAAAWATRGSKQLAPVPARDQALAQIGQLLLCRPERRPGRSDVDPEGLAALIAEDVVYAHPVRDTLAFRHDVHEDWVLARTFERYRAELPKLIAGADQPLWWLRAMRLLGQMLLEADEDPAAWLELVDAISAEPGLDPAFARSLLVAPLYSERSSEILGILEEPLLSNGAGRLMRLLETLLVFETRLDDALLRSAQFAELGEVERLRQVAAYRFPQPRSWRAFLSWSLPRWRDWPPGLVIRLSEVGSTWVFVTEGLESPFAREITRIAANWLLEVEDARHPDRWDDRRNPFGVEGVASDVWKEFEARLRRILKMGVRSAPGVVDQYLKRLIGPKRLRDARDDICKAPRAIPAYLPARFVDVAVSHFTPQRTRIRRDDRLVVSCYSSMDFNDGGIRHDSGFFPSSPLRGGFADLFAADETEALRMFHRLEMRASVFYRNYMKWNEGRRARPMVLRMPWGEIPLWGDENVYRWSRGTLGPHVLGSAYLALENWLAAQAKAGRPIAELLELVLQRNGLVATASPCINLIAREINDPHYVDLAGPFLAEPRLWDLDLRRYLDDRGRTGPLGFMARNDHYDAAAEVQARYAGRQFLQYDLLLPFQLNSNSAARIAFQERRGTWTPSDLATFEDELADEGLMADFEARLARRRSDTDPSQIRVEEDAERGGIRIEIEPPAEAVPEIVELNRGQALLNEAMRLSTWIAECRDKKRIEPAFSLAEAIEMADRLEAADPVTDGPGAHLFWQLKTGGIVGTAALVARFADDADFELWHGWARDRIIAGCRARRHPEDEEFLIDQAKLFDDPQLFGAEGLGALINRGEEGEGESFLALELATHRLNDIAAAMVGSLDWDRVPDFAWAVLVAALDMCVRRRNRHWIRGDDKRARAQRSKDRARSMLAGLRKGTRSPAVPPPPYVTRWYWKWTWRRPLDRVRVQSKFVFDWSLAPLLLDRVNYPAVVQHPDRRARFEAYLAAIIQWARDFSEDEAANSYQNHYPYELMNSLAKATGKLAAAGGDTALWERFKQFDRRDAGEDLIGWHMDAISDELVISERAPDERFWSAWQPPADFILSGISPPRRYRSDFDHMSQGVSAAGFVGPFMSPIPPDWRYVGAILPAIDRWAEATAHSFQAANALLGFAERLDLDQRTTWLVRWVGLFVTLHEGDKKFWGYGDNGDIAAALLKPLSASEPDVRREIRRLLGVIADAGSLGARDVLSLFASGRG